MRALGNGRRRRADPDRVVMQLDWGAAPRDLDLHCSGPANASGRFHIAG